MSQIVIKSYNYCFVERKKVDHRTCSSPPKGKNVNDRENVKIMCVNSFVLSVNMEVTEPLRGRRRLRTKSTNENRRRAGEASGGAWLAAKQHRCV